ncbi:hypothetical protein H5410_036540 [Solanum commersonii]|uniref:Putative plant transposon protein domain-containing protein n=1 Tax=Solanum commersonii TaxID=4109 RepID=A0A9J5Y7R3_SOLCO|nr:hypothetical protein H5410_036540 [Solanum commersonii]
MSKDTDRYSILHYANFNQVARVSLNIVCSVFLLAKHTSDVTRDRVVLVYMLMKGMPINVGAVLRQYMMKFRNNMRWRFCYGELIIQFLWDEGIEDEELNMNIARSPYPICNMVDFTRTKAFDTSYSHVLST